MRTNELVVDQLQRAFTANAWHGPSLMEVLEDVGHEIAAEHPLKDSHSIWELILHLTAWKNIVRERLASAAPILPTSAEDWPKIPPVTAANWTSTLEKLHRAQEQLITSVRAMTPEAFDRIIPGKDYSAFVMLFGIAQHDDYHGGQIALLKKAARNHK